MELKVASCSITKEQLNAAATSQDVPIFGVTTHSYILHLVGRVRTAFAGVTAPFVTVGLASGGTEFMKSQRVDIAGDLFSGGSMDDKGFCPRLNQLPIMAEASKKVVATFTSSSGNFSVLTAGTIEFVMVYAE